MTELIIINAMWCLTILLIVRMLKGKEVTVDKGATHVSVKGK